MAVFTAIGAALGVSAVTAAIGTAAVAGTAYSISQGERAASAQRAAARTQQRMQAAQALRERRGAIRQALLVRSTMQAEAAGAGLIGTSAYGGGRGAVGAQLGANLGFGSMMSGLGQQYTGFTEQASIAQGRAQLGSAVASFAQMALPYAGQIQGAITNFRNPVYNSANLSRAASGRNLAGGF